jgi:hypothetical protein
MVAGAIVLFLLIDLWGSKLEAPELAAHRAPNAVSGARQADALAHVLLALTAVLITGRLLSLLFRYVGQPPVIGEVVAGILLGPSLLGRVWPEAAEFILPPTVAPYLGVVAQLGVVLYMFLVGLELDPAVLRERVQATVAVAHASIAVPFVLGGPSLLSFTLGSPAAMCPLRASPCSWASPCRSPLSRCWLVSSRTGGCRQRRWGLLPSASRPRAT